MQFLMFLAISIIVALASQVFLHFWLYFGLFLLVSIFAFGIFAHFDCFEDSESDVIVSVFVGVFVCLAANNGYNFGYTQDEISAVKKQQTEDAKPFLSSQPTGDGCTINYWYGNGRKQQYTTKYVSCPNSKTTDIQTYSCGTTKAPKTCTKEVVTTTK